jgi:hypothetical protein
VEAVFSHLWVLGGDGVGTDRRWDSGVEGCVKVSDVFGMREVVERDVDEGESGRVVAVTSTSAHERRRGGGSSYSGANSLRASISWMVTLDSTMALSKSPPCTIRWQTRSMSVPLWSSVKELSEDMCKRKCLKASSCVVTSLSVALFTSVLEEVEWCW